MNDPNELRKQLRELAEAAPQHASANVERKLVAQFRTRHARRMRGRLFFLSAAAVLLLALAVSMTRLHKPHSGPHLSTTETPQNFDAAALSGFVPLPYAQSGVPLGNALVMRVRLRASDLDSLGIPVPMNETEQGIGADVLIGQDGVARAVRLASQ